METAASGDGPPTKVSSDSNSTCTSYNMGPTGVSTSQDGAGSSDLGTGGASDSSPPDTQTQEKA